MQQDRAQDSQLLEQLMFQLDKTKEQYGQLEYKYKHCLQKHKQMQAENEKMSNELKANADVIEGLHREAEGMMGKIEQLNASHRVDRVKLVSHWNTEKAALEEQNERIKKQKSELEEKLRIAGAKVKSVEAMAEDLLGEVSDDAENMKHDQIQRKIFSVEVCSLHRTGIFLA